MKRKSRREGKNQTTPKIKTGPFPAKFFKYAKKSQSHKLNFTSGEDQTVFDPQFPGKRRPSKQFKADTYLIYHKVEDFPAFIEALKAILPFWVKHYHLYRGAATRMAFHLQQRSEPLRQEYSREHPEADIGPMPKDLFEMDSWRLETERAMRRRQPHHL